MLEPTDPTTESTDTPDPAAAEPTPRKRAPRKRVTKAVATTDADPASTAAAAEAPKTPRKRAPRKVVAPTVEPAAAAGTTEPAPAKKATRKRAAKVAPDLAPATGASGDTNASAGERVAAPPAKKAPRKRATKSAAAAASTTEAATTEAATSAADGADPVPTEAGAAPALAAPSVLFLAPPEPVKRPARRAAKAPAPTEVTAEVETPGADADAEPAAAGTDLAAAEGEDLVADPEDVREAAIEQASGARRRRRRGRRGRGGAKPTDGVEDTADDAAGDDEAERDTAEPADADEVGTDDTAEEAESGGGTRRRRRRRRSGSSDGNGPDDPPNTVTHVRDQKGKSDRGGAERDDDGVRGVKGSTRLEAKRQRRRDGRETTRRRAPILTEAEFLARREAVERTMAVRQRGDRTQIAVLEDGVLVEHYVTRASATSYVGNVYLGRVQNVLPSMEAAFVDIGKGRNGVLYAGEVNWDAAGLEGKSRAIENALKSGDTVLVQVTKDPIGHKGARLTSQISLPGRYLVYVPGGGMTGISRRLPDTERRRLKAILKKVVPDEAGVIVRTAAEGASEEDLTRDVERLTAQWDQIQAQAKNTKVAPTLVHGEPDLAIRVVRDVFNEDFASLVVEGDDAWTTVSSYVESIAPDLAARVSRHTLDTDLFHDLRVDEQLAKALDRKVWLPSGGSLVIDRTEAMTVIDVNTGKFVGSGGNLEQTVTRNNLEAAEEIVRQLRLRDVGGIVVIDFIDMVLESNRDLVLRRLTECLGRDRTKHQVAEVTSLGLVQMTRKRVGEGLLEAFSEPCEVCHGRGVIIHSDPVDKSNGGGDEDDRPAKKGRRRAGRGSANAIAPAEPEPPASTEQRQAAQAAINAIHLAAAGGRDELPDDVAPADVQLVGASLQDAAAEAGAGADGDRAGADGAGAAGDVVLGDDIVLELAERGVESVGESRPRRRRRGASRPAGPPAHVAG